MYLKPIGVNTLLIDGRPVISTVEGGQVAVDQVILNLWQFADGKTLPEILGDYPDSEVTQDEIRAGLACLTEARLLIRDREEVVDEAEEKTGSLISIIIVAHNSRDWLDDCLESIFQQTYKNLEVVLIDNGSQDDTEEWVTSAFPWVKYSFLEKLLPFSQAINIGVEKSAGDLFLLLNPDTRLDPRAIGEMYQKAKSNPGCAAVAAKLKLLWAPGFLNGIGNRVDIFSWGTDNGLGHLDLGQFEHWEDLPSACFAAALIPRETWEIVGKVDEKFPMYYEDSEWSYRARGRGFPIIAAPQAVVYHAFSGRKPDRGRLSINAEKLQNVVYGRLRFTIKILDDFLFRYLLSYLAADLIALIRYLLTLKFDLVGAIFRGWGRFLGELSEIRQVRRSFQSVRSVEDSTLFSEQRDMPETLVWRGLPELTYDLVKNVYLPLILGGKSRKMDEFANPHRRPKLLIISHDIVDEKLAGPGMRYLEMSRALSGDLDVTLAVPGRTSMKVPEINLQVYQDNQPESLQKIVERSDVILVSSYLVERYPFFQQVHTRIVVDLYDPFLLENLHYYLEEPEESQEILNRQSVAITNQLARIGDFFICGNERQRDYWLGVLTANGRVNPRNFRLDPALRSLIDVVGFGLPDSSPKPYRFLRGINPKVPEEAKIVLWGGGIWNWLDPLSLIKAWPAVIDQYPQARLVFLGTRHPNPETPIHKMAEEAQSLAEEIGEKNLTIFFFEWLTYQEREALLCEADIGVALHPVHIETRYSMRTRVFDYLWARIPVLITEGDITSEWVREFKIGEVVPPFDPEAIAKALVLMMRKSEEAWQSGFDKIHAEYRWYKVVAPLKNYCLHGVPAPDKGQKSYPAVNPFESRSEGWKSKWVRARFVLRNEGFRGLAHRTWRYFQRNLANFS